MILNDLVGFSHRGGDAQRRMRLLDDALTLLARPFAQREAVIVKPSNITSGLIEAILTLRPQATALLLHAPIAVFLGSIAKKGMWGRLWVRTLFLGLARDDLLPFDYVQEDYLGQTDLQIAAICWLAQQALFARLVNRFGTRIRTLDSEDVTGQPVAVVDRMAALFGVQVDAASIAAGDAYTRHSKSGTAFGAAERAAEVRDAGVLHADEIEKVVVWAKAVADGHGLAMVLPSVLLR